MIKTIIFDWDGTLHNTKALYGSAFREGCRWLCENGYADKWDYTDEEAAEYIGHSAADAWHMFRPDLPDEVTAIPNGIIAEAMVRNIYNGKSGLYPGALEVLCELKGEGYKLAFLSNCRVSYMEAHKEYFSLDKYFDAMYNCEAFNWASKAEIFNTIKKDLPGGYIIIGDRRTDLEAAFSNGLASIGCAYGFGREGELSGAGRIAVSVTQIPRLVKELNR